MLIESAERFEGAFKSGFFADIGLEDEFCAYLAPWFTDEEPVELKVDSLSDDDSGLTRYFLLLFGLHLILRALLPSKLSGRQIA